jgi:hypothetical protein
MKTNALICGFQLVFLVLSLMVQTIYSQTCPICNDCTQCINISCSACRQCLICVGNYTYVTPSGLIGISGGKTPGPPGPPGPPGFPGFPGLPANSNNALFSQVAIPLQLVHDDLSNINNLVTSLLSTNVLNKDNAINPALATLLATLSTRDGDRDDKQSIVKIPTGNNNYGYGRLSEGLSSSESPIKSDEKSKSSNNIKNIGDFLDEKRKQ